MIHTTSGFFWVKKLAMVSFISTQMTQRVNLGLIILRKGSKRVDLIEIVNLKWVQMGEGPTTIMCHHHLLPLLPPPAPPPPTAANSVATTAFTASARIYRHRPTIPVFPCLLHNIVFWLKMKTQRL